jgi:hypothetical protein
MRHSTDWAEIIPADEEAQFEALAQRVIAVQASRTPRMGPGRGLHRRPIQSVRAHFQVRPDLDSVLPADLRVGPWVAGARYASFVRFSNGSFDAPPKPEPDVRGFAFKLVGVPGKKILTGEETPSTQDFLLIQVENLKMSGPAEFVALLEAGAGGSPAGLFFRLGAKLGYWRAFTMLIDYVLAIGKPFPSYATARFNSVTPFRLGTTAARWRIVPIEGAAPSTTPKSAGLAADLRARLATGLAWDFQAQLFLDEKTTPVENTAVDWSPASPWITLGRLEIPAQDPETPEGKRLADYIETLSFDPWHCVEEMRPLGAFNRSRKPTYWASLQNRPHVPEPTSGNVP